VAAAGYHGSSLCGLPVCAFISDYWIDVAFFVGIYALLGLSLNIVLGEVGLFDLGHTAFYAIGAYVTAILSTTLHVPIVMLLPLSAVVAGGFAYLVMSPVIHLKGDYLCIVTIGIGEIVRLTMINNPFNLTGGPMVSTVLAAPIFLDWLSTHRRNSTSTRGSSLPSWCLAWYVSSVRVSAEPGTISVRTRQRPRRVVSTCAPTSCWPRAGAALAGAAGNIYASKQMSISPGSFTFMESSLLFCIVLLGGLGSIPGSILGAAIVVVFPEVFRQFASYRLLFFGLALIVMMIFRPGGIWPRKREGAGLAGLGIEGLPRNEDDLILMGKPDASILKPATKDTVRGVRLPPMTVTMDEGMLLQTHGVTLKFGGLTAVNNFDLNVRSGKITSLMDPMVQANDTVQHDYGHLQARVRANRLYGTRHHDPQTTYDH